MKGFDIRETNISSFLLWPGAFAGHSIEELQAKQTAAILPITFLSHLCSMNNTMLTILKPVSEPGYLVASWWCIPLRHPPQKLLLTNRFYFQQTPGIHAPVGKRKGCCLSGRSPPPPIADSIHVATIARKHSVLSLREINRNNTHTALASMLTYYGWVSSIF
jgi:hypothetical protein